MPVYKDEYRKGFWKVRVAYTDWDNSQKKITKRGFETKREAVQWENDFRLRQAGNLDLS